MTYARLVAGRIEFAPRKINTLESVIFNPPAAVLEQLGYKPVRFSECGEAPAGWCYTERWTETDTEILQSWELLQLPEDRELEAGEALEILLGGENA